jgi:hypothetical protein
MLFVKINRVDAHHRIYYHKVAGIVILALTINVILGARKISYSYLISH